MHREKNGEDPVIYDPQSGKTRTIAEFIRDKSNNVQGLKTYRVDNCEIVEDFANNVLTTEKQGVMFNLKSTI